MNQNQGVLIVLAIVTIAVIAAYKYNHGKDRLVEDAAQPGQYSSSGVYVHISPFKHDIFKQLTLDLFIASAIYILLEVVFGINTFFEFRDFISFKNFRNFRLSIVGGTMLSALGFAVYYQIIEPYIVNRFRKF